MALDLEYIGFASLAVLMAMLAAVFVRSLRDRSSKPVVVSATRLVELATAPPDGAGRAIVPAGRPNIVVAPKQPAALPGSSAVAVPATGIRVMIFIDWPNFAQSWLGHLDRTPEQRAAARAAFERLPYDLIDVLEAAPELAGASQDANFDFAGAHVYDSFISDADLLLAGVTENERLMNYRGYERQLLETGIATIPGFNVHIADRKVRKSGWGLDAKVLKNPAGHIESEEKEVDTALTAALCQYAALDRYDIALLLSDDRDYRPGVRVVQEALGKKVVHVGFYSNTPILRTVCWSFIAIDVDDEGDTEQSAAEVSGEPPAAGSLKPTGKPAHLRAGQNYQGTISELTPKGAWIDLPDQGRYGFLSVRNISAKQVTDAASVLEAKQQVWVKFIGADKNRRIQLSMKVVDQATGKDL